MSRVYLSFRFSVQQPATPKTTNATKNNNAGNNNKKSTLNWKGKKGEWFALVGSAAYLGVTHTNTHAKHAYFTPRTRTRVLAHALTHACGHLQEDGKRISHCGCAGRKDTLGT